MFFLGHRFQIGSGSHPAPYPMGRAGREAENSSKSSADFKNLWSYTSSPQYIFMA